MVRNYVKKPKNQYDDKEIQHGRRLINNGASIQVELGLFIVEIHVDFKKVFLTFKKLKRFLLKFQ